MGRWEPCKRTSRIDEVSTEDTPAMQAWVSGTPIMKTRGITESLVINFDDSISCDRECADIHIS